VISKPAWSAVALCLLLALLLPLSLFTGCGGVQSQKADYLFTQSATGGSIEPGASAGTYTLTLRGVSPRTVRFTERPERSASTIATRSFVADWDATFGNDPPNAVLAFTEPGAAGPDSAVAEISAPRYEPDSGVLTYQARDLAESKGEEGVDWKGGPLGSLPHEFGAASLFIDSSDVDVSQAGKSFYGLCFGDWVKTRPGYDTPPNSFLDTYLQTIAPYTSWITTYRVDWPDINYAIKRAHSIGLKVAACAGVTWTAAGPDPSNQPQVNTLVDLVNGGFADLAIVGNEPEGNRGNPPYPMSSMAADLVTYINAVRQRTGGKVPVGTRLIGQIGTDPAFQPILKACDVVQVNIHPAEYAANGKNITMQQAVERRPLAAGLRAGPVHGGEREQRQSLLLRGCRRGRPRRTTTSGTTRRAGGSGTGSRTTPRFRSRGSSGRSTDSCSSSPTA
jgi:hypothetical protein